MSDGKIAAPLQPVLPYHAGWILDPHFATHHYQMPPMHMEQVAPPDGGRSYSDNGTLWADVICERLTPHSQVELRGTYLFRWFPRSPGLFHTAEAEWARREAFHHLDHRFGDSPIRDHAVRNDRITRPRDYTVVFTPEGKFSMLQGGIGSIFLKPISIEGSWYWLMTGSSNGVAHCGFPLAVPKPIYQGLAEHAFDQGVVPYRIQGSLEFLPHPLSGLFDTYVGVPTVYLKVNAVEPEEPPESAPNLEVSVAVSFLGDYEDRRDIYATYVTFDPNRPDSYSDAIRWMKEEYVEGGYNGIIVTDFDQVKTTFPEAKLALRKILDRQIRRDELEASVALMHARGDVDRYFDQIEQIFPRQTKALPPRTKIFISYAHADFDRKVVKRIRTHLRTLVHAHDVDVWDDTRIRPGTPWEREIEESLDSAKIAIIVISADFLASEFIQRVELPTLLESADAGGLTVLPIVARQTHLSGRGKQLEYFQFVNDPERPIETLSEDQRETLYAKLTKEVEHILNPC